jgi:hypothetical protein
MGDPEGLPFIFLAYVQLPVKASSQTMSAIALVLMTMATPGTKAAGVHFSS